VASVFMEDFILEEVSQQANDNIRLTLMVERLNRAVSTIFRQIAAYRFEIELHKTFRAKGYLSKEEIGQLFQKHMASYMGPGVEQSPGSENWWVYWSHIRSFFYNYSYANGALISKALQAELRKNPQFIEKIKEFLSAGLSEAPQETFKKLGINIADKNFWLEGLEEVETLLEETATLAKKLKKI
ncbi:MAG: M3 family metallopeptidase, partial [bacterium]|nr:M3 family metallopeptidase [bacterium]